jgi:alpha-beta hydrolase superfamily lysophospholipase
MISGEKDIGYRKWTLSAPRAIFLLVHGLGTHSGRWEEAAGFFLKKGISSYAVELRDFDRPDDPAGGSDSFAACYNNILRLYDIAAKDNPAKKIFLVGESLGAIISLLLAACRPGLFDGLVCISPAFVNRYKPKPLDYIKMFAPLLYNPHKQFVLPFDSSM